MSSIVTHSVRWRVSLSKAKKGGKGPRRRIFGLIFGFPPKEKGNTANFRVDCECSSDKGDPVSSVARRPERAYFQRSKAVVLRPGQLRWATSPSRKKAWASTCPAGTRSALRCHRNHRGRGRSPSPCCKVIRVILHVSKF